MQPCLSFPMHETGLPLEPAALVVQGCSNYMYVQLKQNACFLWEVVRGEILPKRDDGISETVPSLRTMKSTLGLTPLCTSKEPKKCKLRAQ